MLAPRPESELVDIAWDRISSAATEQTKEDMAALLVCAGNIESAAELELYYIAALFLRSQGRMDDVIAYKLVIPELIWAALYPHLRNIGYDLHSRYAIGLKDTPATPWANYPRTMSATQSSSGRKVMLKIVCTRPENIGGEELDILQFLNDPALRRHPENATVDLLDVLDLPTPLRGERLAGHFKIIVMPFLQSLTLGDRFDTGSTLDLMRQAFLLRMPRLQTRPGNLLTSFQIVAFLHSHGICHRDIARRNFMLSEDTTSCQLRIIDFGQSFRLSNDSMARGHAIRGPWVGGLVDGIPESRYERETLHDPFKAEVYALAEMWEQIFVECPHPVQVLIDRMKDRDSDARPTVALALQGLDDAIDVLPPHVLREPQWHARTKASDWGSLIWTVHRVARMYFRYLLFLFPICCFLLFSLCSSASMRVS